MKLLLTSGGLMNNTIINGLKDLAVKPFSELNLAFIPTASNLEEGDKWWLLDDLADCRRLKFKQIDIVDISALPRTVWQKRLEEADVLLFEGGNTFHLMYWVNHSGLKELLPSFLKSKIYIGVSAGTIVATPSLFLSTAEKQPLEDINEEISEEGLNLVNFLVVPHLNNPAFPENTFDYIGEKSKKVSHAVYALDDNSAIKVINKKIEVISEGSWKRFN